MKIHNFDVRYNIDGTLETPLVVGTLVQRNNLVNQVTIYFKTECTTKTQYQSTFGSVYFTLYCRKPDGDTLAYPYVNNTTTPTLPDLQYFENGYGRVVFTLSNAVATEIGRIECTLELSKDTGETIVVGSYETENMYYDNFRKFIINCDESVSTDAPIPELDAQSIWNNLLLFFQTYGTKLSKIKFDQTEQKFLDGTGYYNYTLYWDDDVDAIVMPPSLISRGTKLSFLDSYLECDSFYTTEAKIDSLKLSSERISTSETLADGTKVIPFFTKYGDYMSTNAYTPDAFRTNFDIATASVVDGRFDSLADYIADIVNGVIQTKAKINNGTIKNASLEQNILGDGNKFTLLQLYSGGFNFVPVFDSMRMLKFTTTSNFKTKMDIASAETLSGLLSDYNTFKTSHTQDYQALLTKVNNFLDVNDTTLDQLSEVIAFIRTKQGSDEFASALSQKADKTTLETSYYTIGQTQNKINEALQPYAKTNDVVNIVRESGELIEESEIDIGTSTDYDVTSDTQIPTTKATKTMVAIGTASAIEDFKGYVEDEYQPKGNYLTSHQDISGKQNVSSLETDVKAFITKAYIESLLDSAESESY